MEKHEENTPNQTGDEGVAMLVIAKILDSQARLEEKIDEIKKQVDVLVMKSNFRSG